MFARLLAIFGIALLLVAPQQVAAQDKLTVFAAASMRNALDDVDKAFTKATGVKVTASYAASSALAKQIAQGAPADIYVSANIKWMDFLAQKKLVAPGMRINLLGNRLVLIAPQDSKLKHVAIAKGFDIAKLAGDGRIAMADTKGVPAGLYAKAALTFARRLEGGGAEAGASRERARDFGLRGARRNAARYRLSDRCQDRAQGEDRRRVSGRLAPAHHLSGGGDRGEQERAQRGLSAFPADASRQGDLRALRLQLPGAAEGLVSVAICA